MTAAGRRRAWQALALGALLTWFAAVLVANGPGHLSVDSLIQLAEGRRGVLESYHPVFITLLLGKLANLGGTRLLVVCSTLLLLAALWALMPRLERPGFAGVLVLACLLAAPILLIYPAIVWKDVWFAHAALLGFGLIARRDRLPWASVEAGCLVLFAVAMLSRQSGVIVAAVGVATLGWARWADRAPAPGARRGAGPLLAGVGARLGLLLALAVGLSALARLAVQQGAAGEVSTGLRLLLLFDVAGMVVRQPAPDLSAFAALGLDVDGFARTARATFRADRVDYLDVSAHADLWTVPMREVARQWVSLVAADPAGYLAHRADVFSWLLGLRTQADCLPVYLGYEDLALAARAGVTEPASPNVTQLYAYALRFVDTPYFAPAAWALVSLIALAAMWRRRLRDPAMAGLQAAGLAYLASYFPVAISCDFRYAYFSVLCAMVALVWLATGALARRGDAAGG